MHDNVENYPLDEALIALLAEINQQTLPWRMQAQGAVVLFIRQHNLTGNWQVAANGRELVKISGETTDAAIPQSSG